MTCPWGLAPRFEGLRRLKPTVQRAGLILVLLTLQSCGGGGDGDGGGDNQTPTASLNRDTLEVVTYQDSPAAITEVVRLTIRPSLDGEPSVSATAGIHGIDDLQVSRLSASQFDITITFQRGNRSGISWREGVITISACLDAGCTTHIRGSPLEVQIRRTVHPASERGIEPLLPTFRTVLGHNVVDAEFTGALNGVVMVGSYPTDSLYFYDTATGAEREQPLTLPPTSVSVSPDGLRAAVGHNGRITIVDLAQVGQPGAPTPAVLDVSTNVFDLAFDGRGVVHALPRGFDATPIRSVDIARNIESVDPYSAADASTVGRLHPSGDSLYTSAAARLRKWDLRTGTATWMYDVNLSGSNQVCNDHWYRDDGSIIYTACGDTYRSSASPAQDVAYAGSMAMPMGQSSIPFRIGHLIHTPSRGEIALIEWDVRGCDIFIGHTCYTHLALLEDEFLTRTATYSILPIVTGGSAYYQRGLFVFRDAVSSRKYLITKLEEYPEPDTEYALSVID